MKNTRLDELQAAIKIAGRNINNLRYADDTTLMAESEEERKSLLMKVKEESEKAGLELNIQKTKIRLSGLITSWQIEGEKVEVVMDFIFLGSKITADGNCGLEIKRCLFLGRKAMTNPDSVLKSRDITLTIQTFAGKTMAFPVFTFRCECLCLVAQSYPTACNPMDKVACQDPLPMEFSRQEYWSGLPFPSPGDLPNPGSKPRSPAL